MTGQSLGESSLSTTDILGLIILCCEGGRYVHGRMFMDLPSLYGDVSSNHSLPHRKTQNISRQWVLNFSQGGKITQLSLLW